jgi:hypothetical protein
MRSFCMMFVRNLIGKEQYIGILSLSALWFLSFLQTANAQTPWDAIFMPKRELCAAVMYDKASWNQYWEGDQLVQNNNVGTFRRQSINAMLTYGITNFIDATLMLPYVSTSATAGQLNGVNGWQDLSASLKARLFHETSGQFHVDIIGNGGFSMPISNYLSDYMPFSIGLGCPEANLRLTSELTFKQKYYFRASGAHIWRGATRIERDYYYQNGSVYSEYMNVPNALSAHGALGLLFFEGRLRTEITYWGTWCTSGDDIRRWLRPQPTNKFDFQQVGFFAQYYLKFYNRLSLIAYANQMISGRNMGKFSNVSIGATYFLKL